MRTRANGTVLFGLILLCSTGATRASAQAADSTHRWSLYGGTVPTESWSHAGVENLELGGSLDFRAKSFPLPLRASVAFGKMNAMGNDATMKFGTLSLDAVGRPLPKIFGTRLYVLGGGGVGIRGAYSGFTGGRYFATDVPPAPYTLFSRPAQTWAFLEGGLGVDVGKMFFQMKLQAPVASQGYTRVPISIGFHF